MSVMHKKETSVYAYLEKPSMVDYPKHFAAVFFISGCGFTCGFCHNAPLMAKKQAGLSWDKLEAACAKFKKDWVTGAVITGGEPTSAHELPELISLFKDTFGFAVKLDTNGSNPKMLAKCLPQIDYVAMDIKCGFSAYPEVVGFPDIGKLEESIRMIQEQANDYEFRTTIIETIHTDEQMLEVAEIVRAPSATPCSLSFRVTSFPTKSSATSPAPPPPALKSSKSSWPVAPTKSSSAAHRFPMSGNKVPRIGSPL